MLHAAQSGWRELRRAYRNIPKSFAMVWAADRRGTIALFALVVVSAVFPVSQAWVGKLIIDAVTQAFGARMGWQAALGYILPYLLLEFGLLALTMLISYARQVVEPMLNARVAHHTNSVMLRKAIALELQHFEDDAFYNKLQNAQAETNQRSIQIVTDCFGLVQSVIALLSILVGLLTFNPLITLVLLLAIVPSFVVQNHYNQRSFILHNWLAPEMRRMSYLQHLLTSDAAAKEIRLFGLGEPLLGRYNAIFWQSFRQDYRLGRRRALLNFVWSLAASLIFYGGVVWLVVSAVIGAISLGSMTFYLALFRQGQGSFQMLLGSLSTLFTNGLYIGNLFDFLDIPPAMAQAAQPQPLPPRIRRGIEFRNVWFRYPDRAEWALRGVSLTIAPGERVALVGQNGAGKTTLIKLMTRLYDPTEGQVLLDGVDLRDYDLHELRGRIGVIFQDFVNYQASVRENVGYGRIEALHDAARIQGALERGGADELVAGLPGGIDTMLGNWFLDGHQLSGGQWQRIALSRAFMRDSDILVLDEPTAALDAEYEHEIFQRFRDLTSGKIAILISHRFSTVRMADRIVVLEGGQISECGEHAELVDQSGTYARLFELQAAGYR